MDKDFFRKKRSKSGLIIMIVAAVVLETTAVLQYYYTEHVIKIASEQVMQAELKGIDLRVDALSDSTETAQLNFIVEYMKQYPQCSYTVTSSDGKELLPSPDTIKGNKYHTFREEVGTQGWQLSVLIPDNELYGRLRRLGGIVTILMLLGLVMLALIIYRSAKNIINLVNVEESKQRIENELQIARNIQMSMLPKTFPPYPDREDLNMYGIIIPAKEVGGDLYDFYVRDEKLLFCIGDVSGKGVPASLVMAVTRSLFRTVSAHQDDAATIVIAMNEAMSEMNEQSMFVTFFLGVFDLNSGTLDYCNAGHNVPVVIEHNKHIAKELSCQPNIPLGVLSGYKFMSEQTTLTVGDELFLYTDGLTEAENSAHQLFGEERMMTAIANWKSEAEAKEQLTDMQSAVHTFVGSAEQSDDLTMLSIIWIGNRQSKADDNGNNDIQTSRLTMRNDIKQIPTLAEWLDSIGLPDELNMTINLALEEAVSNVMLYAYPEGKSGAVEITAEKAKKQVVFTIEDSGKAFDPTLQKEPDLTLSAEERPIGGLGIHLVRQIMDDIRYERKDNKNILTLTKRI